MDLKHQLLEKCTEILTEISSQQADDFFGTPPSVFYIDYGSGSESRFGFELTRIEETYRLFDGKIEVVKVGTEAQSEPVSRMFFKEGHATIG